MTRGRRLVGIFLAAGAALAGSALFAARTAQQANILDACVVAATGRMRLVADPAACKPNEFHVAWNITGPDGATGAAGLQGVPGLNGRDGRDGAPGPEGPEGPMGATGPAGGGSSNPSSIRAALVLNGPPVAGGPNGRDPNIPVLSYAWGLSNTVSLAGGLPRVGVARFSDLTIVKAIDGASPTLFQMTGNGRNFDDVRLRLYRIGSRSGDLEVAVEYAMSDVYVTAVQPSAAPGDGTIESVSFTFAMMQVTFNPENGGPVIHTCWDALRNVPC